MAKYILACQTCKGSDFEVIEKVKSIQCTNCKDEIDLFKLNFHISKIIDPVEP